MKVFFYYKMFSEKNSKQKFRKTHFSSIVKEKNNTVIYISYKTIRQTHKIYFNNRLF